MKNPWVSGLVKTAGAFGWAKNLGSDLKAAYSEAKSVLAPAKAVSSAKAVGSEARGYLKSTPKGGYGKLDANEAAGKLNRFGYLKPQ